MRFKQFLNEDGKLPSKPFTQSLEVKEVAAWIKKHAPSYIPKLINNDRLIWRGSNHEDSMFNLGDTSKFKRTSVNTQNYYTKWIASSPKWKAYPSREHAFICATSKHVAQGFGEPYVVIPADNAHIGICPTSDIWSSFREQMTELIGTKGLATLNTIIIEIGILLDGQAPKDTDGDELHKVLSSWTYEELVQLQKLSSVRSHVRDDIESIVDFMGKHKMDNFKQAVDYVLDPVAAKFEHVISKDFKVDEITTGKEVWISGQMVFAQKIAINKIIEELK